MTHLTMPAAEAFKLLSITNPAIVIDVRSEGEYDKAHFGNTLNMPILSDAHRHEVGLAYKTEGSEAAKVLGHQLVSGDYKERMIQQWCEAIKSHPQQPALIFCWRGGLRSRLAQDWVYQNGLEIFRVESGYKGLRHEALKVIENPAPFVVLSGMTGSGKTRLGHKLRNFIDLEALAKHRGSAFGSHFGAIQPHQATFENKLAQSLYHVAYDYVLEDESPNIGRCHLPDRFYARMVSAPMVMIETPTRIRAMEIFKEYIQAPVTGGMPLTELESSFAKNIERIRNKLGGLECDNIKQLLSQSFQFDALNEAYTAAYLDWIERLLTQYYDKLYIHSLSLKSRKTLYTGSWQDCLDFLTQFHHE
ncbi:tRNA 2-selenouridine(34) synthase MnmH [Methylicorpusculum oleiharenae]|uniref:tRNA 2-selenouridine(34) synthase MnmH n=1 Tax=Methylicorpusculum oleiharenae TaxID=1338687 RepID=UPI0013594C71|nr:tRNA 2-selenouridine(34) synthase MnmH [Methylicorpusculum oleiharenae]MCD2451580.1 tRNA 2-selenouridine(34) synthase MnmH [Methylicorpusculum oleiharenae]